MQNGDGASVVVAKRRLGGVPVSPVPSTTITPPPRNDSRPRHFASYHPVNGGNSNGNGPSRRKRNVSPSPPPRRNPPSPRPAVPRLSPVAGTPHTKDHPNQQPRSASSAIPRMKDHAPQQPRSASSTALHPKDNPPERLRSVSPSTPHAKDHSAQQPWSSSSTSSRTRDNTPHRLRSASPSVSPLGGPPLLQKLRSASSAASHTKDDPPQRLRSASPAIPQAKTPPQQQQLRSASSTISRTKDQPHQQLRSASSGNPRPHGHRDPTEKSMATGKYPPGPSKLKPAVSLADLRAEQYTSFSYEKAPVNAAPFASDIATPPRYSNKPYHYNNHPELHFGDHLAHSSPQSTTTRSSNEQASGTERNSVLTRSSSMSDLSPAAPEEDEGMSVDDAIAMYLDGFADDPIPESQESAEDFQDLSLTSTQSVDDIDSPASSTGPQISSKRIPDDRLPTPPPPPPPPRLPTPPATATPSPTPQNRTLTPGGLSEAVPPPLGAVTADRDQYGFRKSTAHVTIDQYDAWYKTYSEYLSVRRQKWVDLLASNGLQSNDPISFPSRSSKTKRFVRKGIPPEFRGSAWFWYADGHSHLNRNPGVYGRLVETALKSPMNDDKEHIERDLHRTFPDNIYFKPQQSSQPSSGTDEASDDEIQTETLETPIIRSLRHVLYAFSIHNPKIGYTQSLNFIAGMLLLFLPEEKAFWMLHIITTSFLPGTHEVSLEGANADLWILMVVLKEALPAVYTKVASQQPTTAKSKPPAITTTTRLPDITLGLTNWLMSMFISSLPLETTLRVWDILFYEGPKTFFRVALAVFRLNQKALLNLGDPMEIFQLVQSAPRVMIDPNSLIDECYARRFRLSESRLETLRDCRREAIRANKERMSYLAERGKLGTDIGLRSGTGVTSRLPGAWRSLTSPLK